MNHQRLQQNFQSGLADNHEELSGAIWSEIVRRANRSYLIKAWVYRALGALSVVGLVPAVRMLVSEISTSGFFEYFSLIFTHGAVTTSLKELALVLVEALPVTSTILCLALVFVLFNSIRLLAGQKHYSVA